MRGASQLVTSGNRFALFGAWAVSRNFIANWLPGVELCQYIGGQSPALKLLDFFGGDDGSRGVLNQYGASRKLNHTSPINHNPIQHDQGALDGVRRLP